MAKLIYSAIASLDGYVEDKHGTFEWAAPDDEVFAFVNDCERPIGTYLYGRRMYETMVYWETAGTSGDQPAVARDFAEIWRAADKIVYSRTLETASSARTSIESDFDPEAVRQLKATADRDLSPPWNRQWFATLDREPGLAGLVGPKRTRRANRVRPNR